MFSTKYRAPCLTPAVRARLYPYLSGVSANCHQGSTADHVHLALRLHRTRTIAFVVERLKTSTSKRLKAAIQN